jgi:hypothetical protein
MFSVQIIDFLLIDHSKQYLVFLKKINKPLHFQASDQCGLLRKFYVNNQGQSILA